MRIIADTNLLVRASVRDDQAQAALAEAELADAEVVAVATHALCEFVWVLSSAYKRPLQEIASSIRNLINSPNISADIPAVEAGLAFLDAGGDFADGVIAHQGSLLGGDVFVSFDKEAVKLVTAHGGKAALVS